MTKGTAHIYVLWMAVALAAGLLSPAPAAAQNQATVPGASVHMIVTAEPHQGAVLSTIHRDDVLVYQGHNKRPVTGWTPYQGSNDKLQLYILIDDALASRVEVQLSDLRAFISGQPASTAIGLAYMRNGTVQIAQKPTHDHATLLNSLRQPQAITGGSAYESLVSLIKEWPAGAARREVVMVTPGVEPFYPPQLPNPGVDQAISAAQRAGILVFAIYGPAAGHWGHTWWRITWAQTYLSQLADETGADGYGLAGLYPVSFTPYLDNINQHLRHQYQLSFVPASRATGLQAVRVTTEVPKVDLLAADKVFVPPAK